MPMNKILIQFFLLWLVLLFAVGAASIHFRTYGNGKCLVRNQLPYYRWDSFWYTSIARHGYSFSTEKNSSIAYFPLYPLSIRAIHAVTNVKEPKISLAENILFAFCSVILLFRLARFDYDVRISRNIVLAWLFFPPAYFFLSGYPEALFVFLVIASFWFARKGEWGRAGLASALLAVTKPYGILILPALFVEYATQNGWNLRLFMKRADWLPLLAPLATFGAFIAYNAVAFGHPLAFLDAQATWGRSIGNPLPALSAEAEHYAFGGHALSGSGFPYLTYVAEFLFALLAIRPSWHRVRPSYLVFSVLLLLLALLTGTLTSFGRYMLDGVFLIMGLVLYLSEKKKPVFMAYLAVSAVSMLFLANLFARCFPVE